MVTLLFSRIIWCISGVMVIILTSRAVGCGFEPPSSQAKDYKIDICCFSAKHPPLRRKSRDCSLGIMLYIWATYLHTDCCFSELALLKCNKAYWSYKMDIIIISSNVNCSPLGIAEKLLILVLNNNISLTQV